MTPTDRLLFRGFLEDDTKRRRCLEKAGTHAMPASLRELFASILIHGAPADPGVLCDSFKGLMSEDILRSLRRVIASTDSLALLLYPCAA